jgi:hypothetical protein
MENERSLVKREHHYSNGGFLTVLATVVVVAAAVALVAVNLPDIKRYIKIRNM